MRHVVYALVDEFGSPRYVGQTSKSLHLRLSQHHSFARNGTRALDSWLRACPDATIVPLEVDPPDVDAAERRWIAQMRLSPALSLLNLHDGGRRAPSGLVHTDEVRARISAARKGKPLSPDHRAKLSAAHTGVPLSEAHREAIGRGSANRDYKERPGRRGFVFSAETRAKMSAAKMGEANPMTKAKRAERARMAEGDAS